MTHNFMEEKAKAAADEGEHLTILTYLPQLGAYQLKNVAPSLGGLKFEREKYKVKSEYGR
jgi:hypothetical protein